MLRAAGVVFFFSTTFQGDLQIPIPHLKIEYKQEAFLLHQSILHSLQAVSDRGFLSFQNYERFQYACFNDLEIPCYRTHWPLLLWTNCTVPAETCAACLFLIWLCSLSPT